MYGKKTDNQQFTNLFCTKPLLVYLFGISHLFFYPNSSPQTLLLHHFPRLLLTPPHSLQCLHSDSYVLKARGLLLICAEWVKAVLAWGKKIIV